MYSRIYQDTPLSENTNVLLDAKTSHYLLHVLRCKVNDSIIIFNGQGGEFKAKVKEIKKKNVSVEIEHFIDKKTLPSINIILGQSVIRNEKMDLIMQKSVELGVRRIVPLMTARCNQRVISDERFKHWRNVVISACEQSGRNDVPEIEKEQPLIAWLNAIAEEKNSKRFIFSPYAETTDEHKQDRRFNRENQLAESKIVLLIGPEGGFRDDEIIHAQQCGFVPIQLGPRILRTETATISALTLMQFCYGDFDRDNNIKTT